MKRKMFFFALFVLSNGFCIAAGNKNIQTGDAILKKTRDSTFVFKFEAVVDTVETFSLPNSLRIGVTYKREDLKKLSDSCELMSGFDANFRLTLKNVTYSDTSIFSKGINKWYLHIHSPVKSFAGGLELGKRYRLELWYNIINKGIVDFYYFEAHELK
jgi:hypothetical protein